MAENTNKIVVDASYILAYLIEDEYTRHVDKFFVKYFDKVISLMAPELINYEISNALAMAVKRKRVKQDLVNELYKAYLNLQIHLIKPDFDKVLTLSIKHNITAYDAAYLVLAKKLDCPLLSLDKKLTKLAK